jgi:hypothetical protein
MDDNKYYIPKIEEFHVGFAFESLERTSINGDFKWTKLAYMQEDALNHRTQFSPPQSIFDYIESKSVRVKLPDKECIESLGWHHDVTQNEQTAKGKKEMIASFCIGEPYGYESERRLCFNEDTKTIKISHKGESVFYGTINNKSELSLIMKMVGITKE